MSAAVSPRRLLSALALAAFVALGARPIEARAQTPRPVRVQTVRMVPAENAATYSGTVQARVLADLAFRVGGKVIERPVSIGDQVKAGQVLARLDPADLQLTLESDAQAVAAAQADARNAHVDFDRYQRLGRDSPAFLPSEFDKRQAAANMADARLAQAERQFSLARDQLDYATLRADADGLITALPVEVGQVVTSGQTVASLAHDAETEVVVDVPENRLPAIRGATDVAITLWSAPDAKLRGRVRSVGALADAASRTFAVRISVLDPPPGLLGLGMTASVRFSRPGGPPVALLPASALVDQGGKPAVWVLDPKRERAELHPVQVAAYGGDGSVAIAAGLTAGEQVVTAGADLLDGDMPVIAWAGPSR